MEIPLDYKRASCMVRASVAYSGRFELIKSLEDVRQRQVGSDDPASEMQNLMQLLEHAGNQVTLSHVLLQSTAELIKICDRRKLVFVGLPQAPGFTKHIHFVDRYQAPNRFGNRLEWVPEGHFIELTKFAQIGFSAFFR